MSTATDFIAANQGPPAKPDVSVFDVINAVQQKHSVDDIENVRLQSQKNGLNSSKFSHSDALRLAVMYGHYAYGDFLLKHHLVESLSPNVCCPLLITAVRLDRPQITELLCRYSRKADFCYVNSKGCKAMECRRTALHVAAEMSSITNMRILLQYGANPSMVDNFRQTPLDRILQRSPPSHLSFNTLQCVILLLRCKRDIDLQTICAWNQLLDRNPSWRQRLGANVCDLQPGPFSLAHQCRLTVRKYIGYPRLPEALHELNLPKPIVNYLDLEC